MKNLGGGYTMWARKTIESEIFVSKPAEWFKIWFYIISQANWDNDGKHERGSFFTNNEEIANACGTSVDQVKRALHHARHAHQLRTARSTRGMTIFVLNFAKYQDPSTYSRTAPRTARAPQARLVPHHDTRRIEELRINNNTNTMPTASPPGVQEVMVCFYDNINQGLRMGSLPQRKAAGVLAGKIGLDKLLLVIKSLSTSNLDRYAPKIYTPLDLQTKWSALVDHWKRQESNKKMVDINDL